MDYNNDIDDDTQQLFRQITSYRFDTEALLILRPWIGLVESESGRVVKRRLMYVSYQPMLDDIAS